MEFFIIMTYTRFKTTTQNPIPILTLNLISNYCFNRIQKYIYVYKYKITDIVIEKLEQIVRYINLD